VNPATATKLQAPSDGLIEVLLTLEPSDYAEMGMDLERVRERLNLPRSVSNTTLIREAVRLVAESE
jgi:hypothetical protein